MGGLWSTWRVGKIFGVQAKLLEHRRKHHSNSVKTCRNLSTDTCKYGHSKCWFNHNESADNNEMKNSEKLKANEEVIERIFKLMEKIDRANSGNQGK